MEEFSGPGEGKGRADTEQLWEGISMRNEFRKRGGKRLVFLEAWDVIDHGIQNVFCTVQVYGKRSYAEKSQSKLCIKYKSSFMKKADTHKVLSS